MPAIERPCVNHPRRATRVSCAACGSAICPACMRETPVGMKCPSCARLPLRARGVGRPQQYAKATAAGLGSALALGALITFAHIGLFGLILPIIVGLVVGKAVAWGSGGLRHSSFLALAAACVIVGVVLGGLLIGAAPHSVIGSGQLVGLLLAGMAAAFGARQF